MITAIFVIVASSFASASKEHHALRNVLGAERVDLHFVDSDRFLKISNHVLNEKKSISSDYDQYITCTPYKSGREAKETLIKHFGEGNVHTAYTDKIEDSTCFVVAKSATDNNDIVHHKLFRFWTIIPQSLKIHQSAMYYFGLIDKSEYAHSLLLSGLKTKDKLDTSKLQLVVDSGVGIVKPTSRIFDNMMDIIKQQLRANPKTHLDNFVKALNLHEEHGSVWVTSKQRIQNVLENLSPALTAHYAETHDDVCMFSKLSLKQVKNSVIIDNLHVIEESSVSPQDCYASLLSALALQNHVIDIRIRGKNTVSNDYTKGILQTSVRDYNYPYHAVGLNGTDQIVGIGDTGLDDSSCFMCMSDGSTVPRSSYTEPTFDLTFRKVIQYIAYMNGHDTAKGHGSHVAGTIAGNVINENEQSMMKYGGNAPASKIAFFDMSIDGNSIYYPEPIGENVFQVAYDAGARLHSNSWGGPLNMYDPECIDMDAYHYSTPQFLALFAGGNDGSDGYYSIGNPAIAKNIISIGATMSSDTYIESMAYFSGIGPTFDGRIKPDISAPGYYTTSLNATGQQGLYTCSVVSKAGTSMATPAAAGVAATVRQYFEDEKFWATMCNTDYSSCGAFAPKGATVKAALIHSGEPMALYNQNQKASEEPPSTLGNPPDAYQGFGRIYVQNVLPYTGIETVLDLFVEEITMKPLNTITYTVTITDTTRPVKATIVWMDPPNSIISGKMLLHNIDLKIIGNGVTTYGNNNAKDDMNNVEQAVVYFPTAGTYQVVLTSHVFTEADTQDVSLIITSTGVVSNKVVSDTSESDANNPLSCGSNQQLVTVKKMDRGGDGWGDDNSYAITDSEGTIVHTGTMTPDIPYDSLSYDEFCLDNGVYTVSLVMSGTNTDQMGVEVSQCGLYLSEYHTSGTMTLSADNTCNPCGGYNLPLYLVGSVYGIPYGWKQGSKYTVSMVMSGMPMTVATGTLVTGVQSEHFVCLSMKMAAPDHYLVQFTGVPATDDFLDDDYLSSYVGVEEYKLDIAGCDIFPDDETLPYVSVSPGSSATMYYFPNGTITVNGDVCTTVSTAPTSAPTPSSDTSSNSSDKKLTATAGFIVGITFGVLALVGIVGALLYFRRRLFYKKNQTPLLDRLDSK